MGSSAGEVVQGSILFVDSDTEVKGNLTGEDCDFGVNNADAPAFVAPAPTVLTQGLYKITTLNVRFTGLYDDDTGTFGVCTSSLPLSDALGDALRFTIPAQGEKVIRIVAHIDVWEDVLDTTGPGNCTNVLPAVGDMFSCATCDAGP